MTFINDENDYPRHYRATRGFVAASDYTVYGPTEIPYVGMEPLGSDRPHEIYRSAAFNSEQALISAGYARVGVPSGIARIDTW